MSEICLEIGPEKPDAKLPATLPQDDVVQQKIACATKKDDRKPKTSECGIPIKKRKTRRGKSKRRYPFVKTGRKSSRVIEPRAPYNSNQFLLEDHGDIENLDEKLKPADQISTTSPGRTRDSSFSVDSDREFYSSPDDEEEFLIKDFVDQYESVQAERFQSMSKDELIQEYLSLEKRFELLTKWQIRKGLIEDLESMPKMDLEKEVERLTIENETLKRENAVLRNKTCSSDSDDSETDSNDSCTSSSGSTSSSSSSNSSRRSVKPSSPVLDYLQTNGHSPGIETG